MFFISNVTFALNANFHAHNKRHVRPKIPPEVPQRPPTDVFLPITSLLKQTSWRRYSNLALDYIVVSPFVISVPTRMVEEPATIAKAHIEYKRQS